MHTLGFGFKVPESDGFYLFKLIALKWIQKALGARVSTVLDSARCHAPPSVRAQCQSDQQSTSHITPNTGKGFG